MRRIIIAAILLAACEQDPDLKPPPIGASSSTTLPSNDEAGDESSTGAPEPCPWDGTCATLEIVSACGDAWGVACGDGFRCVDTEIEAGIVCEDEEGSSGSNGSSSSGDQEWIYEDHVSPCFTAEATNTACHEYCEGLDDEEAPTACLSTNLWECAYSQLLDTCDDPIVIPGGVTQCDEPMETPTLWRCLCARNPDNPCYP